MKTLLTVAIAILLLSGCASEGQFRTSTSLNGRSFQSMDMTDPHFYMDDDASPFSANPAQVPTAPRYGIDSYCGYCARAY